MENRSTRVVLCCKSYRNWKSLCLKYLRRFAIFIRTRDVGASSSPRLLLSNPQRVSPDRICIRKQYGNNNSTFSLSKLRAFQGLKGKWNEEKYKETYTTFGHVFFLSNEKLFWRTTEYRGGNLFFKWVNSERKRYDPGFFLFLSV